MSFSGISSLMEFYKQDLFISMTEIVWDIVKENDIEKRKFLFEEYMDFYQLMKLYECHIQKGVDKFSWKLCMDEGWLSLNDVGHFKDHMIKEGVTEEEWQERVEREYQYMGKDKVEKYLLEYDEYRKKHKR